VADQLRHSGQAERQTHAHRQAQHRIRGEGGPADEANQSTVDRPQNAGDLAA
jgi:hypothetical protein